MYIPLQKSVVQWEVIPFISLYSFSINIARCLRTTLTSVIAGNPKISQCDHNNFKTAGTQFHESFFLNFTRQPSFMNFMVNFTAVG